jgi:hypothetical protein
MGEQPGVMGSVGEIGGIVATNCKLAAPPTAANWLKVQRYLKGLSALQVVTLRDPIARVAEPVGELRQIERVAQRNRAGGAGDDRREIENGEGYHCLCLA